MVVGASITVNSSRNEGSVDSGGQTEDTKVLKQILAVLKEQNKQSMVAGRKAESGLSGAAAGGGIVGAIAKLVTHDDRTGCLMSQAALEVILVQ